MSEIVGAEWALSSQKRAVDLLGITALAPLFAPAGSAVAATIYCVDKMNPVFTQTRYGLELKPFTLYKFRTMPEDTPPETVSTGSFDERRTLLGRRLSASHFDEIPQTINICNGTMSMVGPRPLILEDIERTLDALSPAEQKEWRAARKVTKPAPFGKFQLQNHLTGYRHNGDEESVRSRASFDIEYANGASFRTDLRILFDTANAAYETLGASPREKNNLPGENAATMFHAVAEGFGVFVTDQEREWWRVTMLAAKSLDDLVDKEGLSDTTAQVKELMNGNEISGMAKPEAQAFKDAYEREPDIKQYALISTYLDLPSYAAAKRTAPDLKSLMAICNEEADRFAKILFLEPTDAARKKFNRWLHAFARAGYLADFVLDAQRDFDAGNIAIKPDLKTRARLGAQAILASGKVLANSPCCSYGHLARGAIRTLLR